MQLPGKRKTPALPRKGSLLSPGNTEACVRRVQGYLAREPQAMGQRHPDTHSGQVTLEMGGGQGRHIPRPPGKINPEEVRKMAAL